MLPFNFIYPLLFRAFAARFFNILKQVFLPRRGRASIEHQRLGGVGKKALIMPPPILVSY
jgi:hypothetical protein